MTMSVLVRDYEVTTKTNYVQVRVTESEKEELKKLAFSFHLNMSSLLLFLFYNFSDNEDWQKSFRLTRKKKQSN